MPRRGAWECQTPQSLSMTSASATDLPGLIRREGRCAEARPCKGTSPLLGHLIQFMHRSGSCSSLDELRREGFEGFEGYKQNLRCAFCCNGIDVILITEGIPSNTTFLMISWLPVPSTNPSPFHLKMEVLRVRLARHCEEDSR